MNIWLSFAGAGNCAFVEAVIKRLSGDVNKINLTIEDLIEIAKKEYITSQAAWTLRKLIAKSFTDTSITCCGFITGLNRNNIAKLFFAHDISNTGQLTFIETDKLIIAPNAQKVLQYLLIISLHIHLTFPKKPLVILLNLVVWLAGLANNGDLVCLINKES